MKNIENKMLNNPQLTLTIMPPPARSSAPCTLTRLLTFRPHPHPHFILFSNVSFSIFQFFEFLVFRHYFFRLFSFCRSFSRFFFRPFYNIPSKVARSFLCESSILKRNLDVTSRHHHCVYLILII